MGHMVRHNLLGQLYQVYQHPLVALIRLLPLLGNLSSQVSTTNKIVLSFLIAMKEMNMGDLCVSMCVVKTRALRQNYDILVSAALPDESSASPRSTLPALMVFKFH